MINSHKSKSWNHIIQLDVDYNIRNLPRLHKSRHKSSRPNLPPNLSYLLSNGETLLMKSFLHAIFNSPTNLLLIPFPFFKRQKISSPSSYHEITFLPNSNLIKTDLPWLHKRKPNLLPNLSYLHFSPYQQIFFWYPSPSSREEGLQHQTWRWIFISQNKVLAQFKSYKKQNTWPKWYPKSCPFRHLSSL